MDLIHYDCMTSAGLGPEVFFKALLSGVDHSVQITGNEWPRAVIPGGRVCFMPDPVGLPFGGTYEERLQFYLTAVAERFFKTLEVEQKVLLKKSKVLIIVSSTKGLVEDYIWSYSTNPKEAYNAPDPFEKISNFCQTLFRNEFAGVESMVISNACASSHVAIEFAEAHIKYKNYDAVLVVAADLIGPFIYQGFQSLKVLSHSQNKPFSHERDGLQLGEAVAVLLFSNFGKKNKIRVSAARSDTEGLSVTRPSTNGESLLRAIDKVLSAAGVSPELIIAHGTGTRFNDSSEEQALLRLKEKTSTDFAITATKWSIGHTLGASGAMDLIAGCEVMKAKKIFNIGNSRIRDEKFKLNYLLRDQNFLEKAVQSILITSLGFGGVHAALMIEAPGRIL
jgi:Beta-ketoacyl synthase, C-terminal domain/Beta-ketoacyl synthase, N-terminal domain